MASTLSATILGVTQPTALTSLLGAPLVANAAAGDVTGMVFSDYNANGTRDTTGTSPNFAIDNGVAGITATAYLTNNVVAATATTNASGVYTLTGLANGTPYRVEFSGYQALGYESAPQGTNNKSSVRFVTGGAATVTSVDFGVLKPNDYCQNNPQICLPVYKNGNASSTLMAMTRLNWDASGTPPTIAQQNQIGSTWGLAYKRDTKQLFASALVKRHAGLGPLGLGGIYVVTNPSAASPTVGTFVDLDAAPFNINFGTLPNNSARALGSVTTNPYSDTLAYPAAGTQGIGDIDMSEDGNSLWAVNLYTATGGLGSLIKMDVSGGSAPSSASVFPLSSMSGLPTCTGGVLRPWALKFAYGKGYLGAVCSAENSLSSNDLNGYVMSFDPANPTAVTIALTIPLTYTKGAVHNGNEGSPHFSNLWHPWLNTMSTVTSGAWPVAPQEYESPVPVLSDIEFDASGAMILGVLDRRGMQWGGVYIRADASVPGALVNTAGDILRACPNSSGVYILENNGICGGVTGSGVVGTGLNGPEGPGGNEFYRENGLGAPQNTTNHEDPVTGGLAYLSGSNDIASSTMDPNGTFWSGGVIWLSNVNGSRQRAQTVYAAAASYASVIETFAKSVGQGDVEVLCDSAPIEIGNRIWLDANRNGIQDPGEAPLSGVIVSLRGPTGTLGTATTDANGNYYFSSLAGTSTTSIKYGLPISPNVQYTLSVPTSVVTNSLTNALTVQNADGSADGDVRDSDGDPTNGQVVFTTGAAGSTNHAFDFGYAPPEAQLQIVKAVTGGSSSATFSVQVQGPSGYNVITTVTTSAARVITGILPGTYTVTEQTPLPSAPSGFVWLAPAVEPSGGLIALTA
ncbi:MAG: hypothetical protein HC853_18945, partial [Anaerolineae bacterium]|nr:hypothetical protein [Anaerolineae bacterium]